MLEKTNTQTLKLAVVGHTNTGKTSLLRTLTRQKDFGEVANAPATTRHSETINLNINSEKIKIQFIDTPGLEDSVALLEYINQISIDSSQTKTTKIKKFLENENAIKSFEQEAKVLKALIENADAAILVIDTRIEVLPKYLAELELLTLCAKPIMPVLNFTRYLNTYLDDWHKALLESNLHVRAEFDAVAPFTGSEYQLYKDLGALLPQKREEINIIISELIKQAENRRKAACKIAAQNIIKIAAMRRTISEQEYKIPAAKEEFIKNFQNEIKIISNNAVEKLLKLYAFNIKDIELDEMSKSSGRWNDDLLNSELLIHTGKQLGAGAAIGAGAGLIADIALAGLSLGAAASIGAAIGGAASGGWRGIWQKVENKINGLEELTAEDLIIVKITNHFKNTIIALEARGHAAQNKTIIKTDENGAQEIIKSISPARSFSEWENNDDAKKDLAIENMKDILLSQLPEIKT